jgi:hypothetical protein
MALLLRWWRQLTPETSFDACSLSVRDAPVRTRDTTVTRCHRRTAIEIEGQGSAKHHGINLTPIGLVEVRVIRIDEDQSNTRSKPRGVVGWYFGQYASAGATELLP